MSNNTTAAARKIRNHDLLNRAFSIGRREGMDRTEILERFVSVLLEMNDEVFQERINDVMTRPAQSLIYPKSHKILEMVKNK